MRGLNKRLREIAIGIGVFGLLVAAGTLAQLSTLAAVLVAIVAGCGLLVLVLSALDDGRSRRADNAGRAAGNVIPIAPSTKITPSAGPSTVVTPALTIRIERPWVIDGDTLDDRKSQIRFRLLGIDAPETKENAACAAEAHLGDRAKWRAVELVRAASVVEAHTNGEIDRYGRQLARIALDGADLGEKLVSEGYAIACDGARKPWCGGALNALAQKRYGRPICQTCAQQRRA